MKPNHRIDCLESKARRLVRHFDRQLRANNTDCFEANGCRKPAAEPSKVSVGMYETLATMEKTLAAVWQMRCRGNV